MLEKFRLFSRRIYSLQERVSPQAKGDVEQTTKEPNAQNAIPGFTNNEEFLPMSKRSIFAFWMLGLCNNYGYVVMLSAAVDIIASVSPGNNANNSSSNETNPDRQCSEMSTGTVLLADIIPSLVIKMIAPFFPLWMHFRMGAIVAFNITGFILVSQAKDIVMALSGVVSIAIASGLGEASILAHMAFYKNKSSISAWSSGTGGAGFFGALSYMLLAYLSGSNRSQPLLIFLIVPVLMGISFWLILESPKYAPLVEGQDNVGGYVQSTSNINAIPSQGDGEQLKHVPIARPTLAEKVEAVPRMLKYMIPFGLVYLFEYFINQGLHELIHFNLSWLTFENQYVAYQLCYQIGVFASRSSINLFTIDNTWLMAILQGINVAIFSTEAIYGYIPSFFIVVVLVLWEGFLGGLSYVNTYNRINKEVPEEKRDFSMSINSFADALGISLAGFIAIPVHNLICSMPLYNHY